jgi:diacylglycerol kinase family enzyme
VDVRALLIVNPHATSTTQVRRDVIVHALASELDLEVVQTRYRGHASSVAEAAARDGYGLVLTLGGDGTVNEAVNGLLRAYPPDGPGRPTSAAQQPATAQEPSTADSRPGAAAQQATTGSQEPTSAAVRPSTTGTAWPAIGRQRTATAAEQPIGGHQGPAAGPPSARGAGTPLFAPLPGGNANVFTRALGLPADPVDATGRILAALSAGDTRTVGLGRADGRYFCFNAGLGLDAEVVRVVEGLRARGQTLSAALYVWTAVRQFYSVTNRREPALTLERDGCPAMDALFLGIVSNTSPWTYLGQRPVNASPEAGFDTGLDLFALRKLSTLRTLSALRQMLSRDGGPAGRYVVSLHDQDALTFRAARPVAFQVDGEYVGEREQVILHSIPNALRVLV